MRKLLVVSSVWLLLMAGLAVYAMADVNVVVDVLKDKDVRVIETIVVNKVIDLNVAPDIQIGDHAAEALALVNQTNLTNSACENCAEKRAVIGIDGGVGSVLNNSGITNVNQAVGNMNNQGNTVAVAVDNIVPPDQPGTPGSGGFAEAQAGADQAVNGVNIDSVNIIYRESVIQASVNNNQGITNVNQAAGQMNNQSNTTGLAACLDGEVALSEADLGQLVGPAIDVQENGTTKTASILTSVLSNTGVVFVNQTSGNAGNQSNTLSLAVSVHTTLQ